MLSEEDSICMVEQSHCHITGIWFHFYLRYSVGDHSSSGSSRDDLTPVLHQVFLKFWLSWHSNYKESLIVQPKHSWVNKILSLKAWMMLISVLLQSSLPVIFNQNTSYLHLNFSDVSNCGHHVASSRVSNICFFVTLISKSLSHWMALRSTNPVSFLYYSVYSAMDIWENKIRANNCME